MSGDPAGTDAWVAEALRLNARYVEEVVIGWGLCPWAAQSWRRGAVARRVLTGDHADVAEALVLLDGLAARDDVEIGFLIFAGLQIEPAAFDRFAEQLRRAERARRPAGTRAPFLVAAFHPESRAEPDNARALVPFIRRTPDPMLQLVRSALIDGLARGGRDPSLEVGQANFANVQARTPAALDAVIRDIHRDRDASYARLSGSADGARGR